MQEACGASHLTGVVSVDRCEDSGVKALALTVAAALLGTLGLAGLSSTATAGKTHHCPRSSVPPVADTYAAGSEESERFDATRLGGKRVVRARRIARRHDCTVRVVKRDGERLPVTDDFRANRINVAVRDRRVTRVKGVF